MRIGCCASLDQIKAIQDAGYDYVELAVGTIKPEQPNSEFEPVRDVLSSYDIRPEAWNILFPPDMKVVGPEVDLYRVERYLRTAFERIEEVGGEIVVFGSGGARCVPERFPREEAYDQLREVLTLAGQVAGAHGITIALEPLHSKGTNIINNLAEGAELVCGVSHPFVQLLADLYHMMEEDDTVSAIPTLGVDIVHAHISDTDRLYPGSGTYPSRAFVDALKSVGYDDRLTVECAWRSFDTECVAALNHLRGWVQE